jgi:hypothetical protein
MSTKLENQQLITDLFPDNMGRAISPQDLRDVTNSMTEQIGIESLISESFADQDPVGLDTPVQVAFGPEDLTSPDVAIDALGTITFLTSGEYFATLGLYFLRTTAVGEAHFMARVLVNDAQSGNPIGIVSSDSNDTIPLYFDSTLLIPPGATPLTYKIEMVRDSGGIDNGGLGGILSTTLGWGSTPSARIRIIKRT